MRGSRSSERVKPESSPDPGYVASRNWMSHLPGNAERVPGVRAKTRSYVRDESWPRYAQRRTKGVAEVIVII